MSVAIAGGTPAQDLTRQPADERTRSILRWRPGATFWCVTVLLLLSALPVMDSLRGRLAYESDTGDFYWPLFQWAAAQVKAGHLPLWAPGIFAGYPIFADGETGLSYPLSLLAMWSLPPPVAFIALRWLHLGIAALGAFALARVWGRSHLAALLAALAFSQGSFFLAQLHHENVIRTAAWLPAALVCAEQALRVSGGTARRRWTAAAAGCVGLAGLGLHPQILVEVLLALAVYGALRLALGPVSGSMAGWRTWLLAVLAVFPPLAALGLGLAAVQLLPLEELASHSARGAGMPYSQAATYSLTVPGLLQLLLPFLFRGPGFTQWGLWTHWESYLFVGVVPLVLAVVALARVRTAELLLWLVIAGLGLLTALGQYSPLPLHQWLWELPGLGGLRAPGRFSLVVTLALAMLAGIGLDRARLAAHLPFARPRWRGPLLAVLPAVLVAVIFAAVRAVLLAMPDQSQEIIQATYLSLPRDTYVLTPRMVYAGLLWALDVAANHQTQFSLALLAGAGLVLWRMHLQTRWRRAWSQLLLAATVLDLGLFGWYVHPRDTLASLSQPDPSALAIASAMARDPSDQPSRVLVSPALAQDAPDTLAPLGLDYLQGYSSLEPTAVQEFVSRVQSVDDGLLDLANVRYVVQPASTGTLPTWNGVAYQTSRPLLSAPNGALGDLTFRLPAGQPLSELRLVSATQDVATVPRDTPVAQVVVRAADGTELARQQVLLGRDTVDWAQNTPGAQHQEVAASQPFDVPGPDGAPQQRLMSYTSLNLAGVSGAATLQIQTVLPRGVFQVYGAVVVSADGQITQLTAQSQTKYQPLYRDDQVAVYQDTQALPRAFLVPSVTIVPPNADALAAMTEQPFDPRTQAIVQLQPGQPAPAALSQTSERQAADSARMLIDEDEQVTVQTDSPIPGLLVLGDRYSTDWHATVDGQPAPLYRADALFRGVAVPAGQHTVTFSYAPGSLRLGAFISAASLLLTLALAFLPLPRRVAR